MTLAFKTIVVATDGSPTAAHAVAHATDLAARIGARLELVSAYSGSAGDETAAALELAATPIRAAGVAVDTWARSGDPVDVILDIAEERSADMIIVGNRGMAGAKRFLLGSVPDKISHQATCSVLIVRTT